MINTKKIIAGVSQYFKKKNMKINGSVLFDYIAKSGVNASDEILDKIEDNKSLKKQHPVVLEFFSKHFINVEVKNVTNKQKAIEIVQSVHKKHHIPLSSITYKSIAFSSVLLNGKMGDLNAFKKPIDEWDENHWGVVLKEFLTQKGSSNESPTQKT